MDVRSICVKRCRLLIGERVFTRRIAAVRGRKRAPGAPS
jgi:hypothetical protein